MESVSFNINKISNTYYGFNHGYFVEELDGWKFIPYEKYFSLNEILDIYHSLKELNKEKEFMKNEKSTSENAKIALDKLFKQNNYTVPKKMSWFNKILQWLFG